MAYCLNTLIETLEKMLHPDHPHMQNRVIDHDMTPQVQSLWKKASFMRDLFENLVPGSSDVIEMLEDQIRDAAQEAEDSFQSFTVSLTGLQQVIELFESVNQQLIKIKDASQRLDHQKRRRLTIREIDDASSRQ